MPRCAAALLVTCAALAGCGSDHERSVHAPATKSQRSAQPAAYESCQEMIAVGTSDDATMTREGRRALKALREAMESDDGAVQCSSDVDTMGEDGWTPYAPLPDTTPAP